MNEKTLSWLLESDPAIRWQVLRDLADADEEEVAAERRKVALRGWGRDLLACQDASGRWGGQLYIYKWISTTYSMLLLRHFGLEPGHPRAGKACRILLDGGFRDDGSITYGKTTDRPDNAVTGMILALTSYFGCSDWRVHAMADYFRDQQKLDGSWEPEPGLEDLAYTIDATLLILDGLLEYSRRHPGPAAGLESVQARGREFLLGYRLFLQADDSPINPRWTQFSFPPRWHYDVLTALDYFQACRAGRDPRLAEAIALVRRRQNRNGSWNLQNRHPGRTFFEMEEVGRPSRWNTLRAARVLNWWQGESSTE